MDLPAGLGSHLRDLVESIGAGDDLLADSLAALSGDLRTAVSSYQGMRLTLVLGGWPVTLTAFADIDGTRPATSLRVALSSVGTGFEPDSQIVLYAGTPGAFLDLAADLAYLEQDGERPAALDADLPPASVVSGLSGLIEYATINHALGRLIDDGYPPEDARALLRLGAAADGLTLPGYAERLLHD